MRTLFSTVVTFSETKLEKEFRKKVNKSLPKTSNKHNYLLLARAGAHLGLGGAADLLHAILPLLALLAGALCPRQQAISNQPMFWLKLLRVLQRVVDQSEAGGAAAAKGSAKAKDEDQIWRGLVHAGDLLADLGL